MSNEKPIIISKPVSPFSATQSATLNALMNLMIPASADGKMPAASSLGLYDDLSSLPMPARNTLERGLNWLAAQSASRHGQAFADLTEAAASALVDTLRHDDAPFVNAFTLQTTGRYLQHDQVMNALGLEARPPWPKGYEVPQGDWGLLDPVRERGAVWRQV
ncbi:MAG: gluconate 2-dehydrogenase subunit 3 family protein [Burkholderiaceae bacterium]